MNATFSNANQEKKIKIISIERMNEERVEKRRGPKKVVELFDEQWACSKSSDSLSQFQTNERIRSNPCWLKIELKKTIIIFQTQTSIVLIWFIKICAMLQRSKTKHVHCQFLENKAFRDNLRNTMHNYQTPKESMQRESKSISTFCLWKCH